MLTNLDSYQDVGIQRLRFAILHQAIDDWKKDYRLKYTNEPVKKGKHGNPTTSWYNTRESIECFLFSPWGELLSGDRGWEIFDKLVQEYENPDPKAKKKHRIKFTAL